MGIALPVIRLTRKFTECLNGVDLSGYRVGDVLQLSDEDARLLIAAGCAERVHEVRNQQDRRQSERRRRN